MARASSGGLLKRVAVVGAGGQVLAAAVRCTEQGHAVTLLEMSRQLGGRARSLERGGEVLDNGQHILIDRTCTR